MTTAFLDTALQSPSVRRAAQRPLAGQFAVVTETLTSVNRIEPEAWNSIIGRNRLICRHQYLRAIEESQINDCRYFYIVARKGETIHAHTCVYFITTELDTFATGLLKRSIECIRKVWPAFLLLRSLECGTPVALGSTISFADQADRGECLLAIARKVRQIAGELGVAAILFRDFYDGELSFYDRLRDLGYVRIRNLPTAHMMIRWRTIEEYELSLRSEYRNKMRARQRQFRKSGATMSVVSQFSDIADDLARLWRNVYDHATEYRREVLLPDFFRNIDVNLHNQSSVIVARMQATPIGFLLLLFDDETLIPLFCGLDYRYTRNCAVYFNLFYEAIDVAIQGRLKSVDFGITTLVPKMELGAEVVQQHMYMLYTGRVARHLVPHAFRLMTPRKNFKARRVFKSCPTISR
jgi:predicted N-acyltransferase